MKPRSLITPGLQLHWHALSEKERKSLTNQSAGKQPSNIVRSFAELAKFRPLFMKWYRESTSAVLVLVETDGKQKAKINKLLRSNADDWSFYSSLEFLCFVSSVNKTPGRI